MRSGSQEAQGSLRAGDEKAALLLCDMSGKIVFFSGNEHVLGIKSSRLIQKNFFQLGFTQFSLMGLLRRYPDGILDLSKQRSSRGFSMEYVQRNRVISNISQQEWKEKKSKLLKHLRLNCSIIKAVFSDERITSRKIEVIKQRAPIRKESEDEELLVAVEVRTERTKKKMGTVRRDYELTCRMMGKHTPGCIQISEEGE